MSLPFFRAQSRLLQVADSVLRGGSQLEQSTAGWRGGVRLVSVILLFALTNGAVMGTFGGLAGDRAWQIVYSATKVPLLLLVTFALGLPNFFVLNTLFGLRDDFPRALRALIATQAGVAVLLAALSPLTLVWYATSGDYNSALGWNMLLFSVASGGAQIVLRREYRPLIASNPRHRLLLRCWLGIYAFVGIQMAWILRPFVGDPGSPVQFFRVDSWGNAYEVVARLLWRLAVP